MKLTATIKNFKKNIIGYFNNENGTSDDMLKVIERIDNGLNYNFVKFPEPGNSSEFPQGSICYIKTTSNLSRNINIDINVTKPFKLIVVGQGSFYINSSGTNKGLNKNELYTFTPITPYKEGDYTVFGKLEYLGSPEPIKVTYKPIGDIGGGK